jgi:CotS family spore coat protein
MAAINKHLHEIDTVFDSYHIPPLYLVQRSVYLAPQLEPAYVLKPLKVGAIRSYLTGALLSKQELCPIIPRLVKPESGGYYLWHSGNRYVVTEKLPGRSADYHAAEDLKAAVIAMSKFHQFGRLLLESDPIHWGILQFEPEREWRQRLQEMEICREIAIRFQEDSFSRQYLQMWHQFYELAFRVLQTFSTRYLGETKTICYHDWAFHNVIIDQGQAFLIDFDDMIVDHSMHDRVNLISRYLRLHQWSVKSLLTALWNFDHYYHWKKGELKLLGLYLTFPYEYWILGRQYYIEKQPWSRRYFQEQWRRKISFHQERLKVLDLIDTME